MATITLYKDKVNSVGGLLDNIIKSVDNLDVQLSTLKSTLQGVDSSTCNLQDTVDSISSSSRSQKEKIDDLRKLNSKLTDFIQTAKNRDSSARDEINKKKEDFYTRYSYLKPECEKSWLEKICDTVKKVGDWCAEHWKLLATIALVAVSIVLLATGVGGIIAGACWGAILGAVIGGVSGGLESMANGGSFLEGFEEGAFSGAVSGAIMGGAMAGLGQLGMTLGKGISCMSKLGKFVKGVAAISKVTSTAMGAFDTVALLDKAFGPGYISDLNSKLHQNKFYNYFQIGVSATAALTGGMTKTMKCFVAGTLILTAAGLVAIENIKAGDKVVSTDVNTMQSDTKEVLETYVRETDRLVHLTVNGEEIITTFDHPFYVHGQGFVNACNLCIGSELVDLNGNILKVESIYREVLDNETRTVYNFKVDEYHTYHVSNLSIFVHNSECGGSYKEVRDKNKPDNKNKPAREQQHAHHMPAENAYSDQAKQEIGTVGSGKNEKVNGPSISMDSKDHTKTASYDNKAGAKEYRAKQSELIKAGKMQEAFDMDVADIKSKFPGKYDSSIADAQKYLDGLISSGKVK